MSQMLIQVIEQLLKGGEYNAFGEDNLYGLNALTMGDKLQIVKTWTQIHLEMLQKFKRAEFKQGIKYMAASDDYARIFASILKFYVPPLNSDPTATPTLNDTGLVTMSGDVAMDLLINELKVNALQCLKILWRYIIKKKPKDIYSAGNMYVANAQVFVFVLMQTMIGLGQQKDFESLMQNGHIQGIVTHGIDILCFLANERDFQYFFTQHSYKIYL